jgi:SpoVK/Ycf46/Vps4 family AAA+-type ATPase
MAKAIATAVGGQFFKVTSGELLSQWQGATEKAIRALFAQVKACDNAVLFVDEVDSLASARSSDESQSVRAIKTEMLTSIDDLLSNPRAVLVMATNCPHDLDDAIRRRAEKRFYIPLPEEDDRVALLAHELARPNAPLHSLSAVDVAWVAAQTDMYSGADLAALLRTATDLARKEMADATQYVVDAQGMHWVSGSAGAVVSMVYDQVPGGKLADNPVVLSHVKQALGKQKAVTTREGLRQYEQWTAQFGQSGR